MTPSRQQLYDELDRFHAPATLDSSWGEWHYFNLVTSPDEWWYITYLVGGAGPIGQLLVSHRRPDGQHERYQSRLPPDRVKFDTNRADLMLGSAFVEQRDGIYRLAGVARGPAGTVSLQLSVTPAPNGYFPPVELRDEEFVSGYVVPGLTASGSGKICLAKRCTRFADAPAYHDHNWGVWREVTWEWGAARGSRVSLLYGGVYGPGREAAETASSISSPFFLTLMDSLGVRQVLRFSEINYAGVRPASGVAGAKSPERFSLVATREADSLQVQVRVVDVVATRVSAAGPRPLFLQMRGRFSLSGRVLGQTVADSGMGFFETYVE
jgi:hypothetical protein